MRELLCYNLRGEFKMTKFHDKREKPDGKQLKYF